MTKIKQVPLSEVVPGSSNDRQNFNQVALEELAESIGEHGLAQPITVRPVFTCPKCDDPSGNVETFHPHTGCDPVGHGMSWCDMCEEWHPGSTWRFSHYEIVAGERRVRAVRILGWETIPAIVRDLSDEAASAIMLAENTGRQDLNPIEEAQAYQARTTRFGWSVERVAKVAGVSEGLVKRRLNLLQLVPEVQHLVAGGHFPIGHAEAVACLDSNRQHIAVRIYRESKNGLPLSAFRGIVGQLLEEQSQESLFDLEHFWVEQVQAGELPRRGKRAVTGTPLRHDLPAVEYVGGAGAAGYIEACIAELAQQGLGDEAGVVGTIYTRLVHLNLMAVPAKSLFMGAA